MAHISHYLKAFKDELEEKSLRTGSPQYAGEATAQHANGGGEKKEAAEYIDCKATPAAESETAFVCWRGGVKIMRLSPVQAKCAASHQGEALGESPDDQWPAQFRRRE